MQLAIVSYIPPMTRRRFCRQKTVPLKSRYRVIARTRGVITCNALWSEFDFTELAFRSVFGWLKKIITTGFVFYMRNNKTSAESFRTVSRGSLLRTCRGSRVGRYNNNNNNRIPVIDTRGTCINFSALHV